ncbi:3-deoxy-D-manno-octulosonic acid kinase [Ferrimonas lipolytica]|uniref:3-deoxy-D-manno-octulosonic acid kinase n=1 Tax=Ferrimonas lipolytica TaxID=2724191 RepID=A0A6H1UIA4_9GAMM|nr:3-deoxy-D-manno-octulosonic acid kinase [Ferrimonas lipolytica]QIZ78359.1 3-deoxy-D-manno-octulosonic acid kinase [Ferrimonas lipolytica]
MHISEHSDATLILADGSPAKLEWFDRDWLKRNGKIVGSSDASGRKPANFLAIDGGQYVLRHYYRGGLPGKVIEDVYLWSGLETTRAYKELMLLEQMVALELPVCKPIAAKLDRQGFSYRADLITERLMGCNDLVGALKTAPLTSERWQELGRVIARFHNKGVFHADLNARNILLNEQQFYLIDFDQGKLRIPDEKWQQANLARLQRSLQKEALRVKGIHWQESDWQHLLKGYQAELV